MRRSPRASGALWRQRIPGERSVNAEPRADADADPWYAACSFTPRDGASSLPLLPRGAKRRGARPKERHMAGTGTLYRAFIDELRDAYDGERQLTKALPKLAKAATPALKKAPRFSRTAW